MISGMTEPRVFKRILNQKEFVPIEKKTSYFYFVEIISSAFYEKKEAVAAIPNLHMVRGFSCLIQPTRKPYIGKIFLTNVFLRSSTKTQKTNQETDGSSEKEKPDIVIGKLPYCCFYIIT